MIAQRVKYIITIIFLTVIILDAASAQLRSGISAAYNITWSEFGWGVEGNYKFHDHWSISSVYTLYYTDTRDGIRHIRNNWDSSVHFHITMDKTLSVIPQFGAGISRFASDDPSDRNFSYILFGAGSEYLISSHLTLLGIINRQMGDDNTYNLRFGLLYNIY